MTATTTTPTTGLCVPGSGEDSVFRLFCHDCDGVSFPLDGFVELSRHTTVKHWRRPTATERTPVDTVAHLRVVPVRVESWAQQLDRHLATAGRLHIDDSGRRWCMIITGFGLTRHHDRWVAAHHAPDIHPATTITDPAYVAALERWDVANPSPDHTLAHGITRPTGVR